MSKMKNHQIVKEIVESFKERITGNKKASRASVIIVAIVLVIVAVVWKFGEYVGTNKVFPKWIDVIFGEDTSAKAITVSCIPIAFPPTDKNAEIRAVTSFEATKVVLICEANGFKKREWNMKTSDSRVWTFDANFYEPNTYTLTVTAYDSNGEQVQDSIVIQYPFT